MIGEFRGMVVAAFGVFPAMDDCLCDFPHLCLIAKKLTKRKERKFGPNRPKLKARTTRSLENPKQPH